MTRTPKLLAANAKRHLNTVRAASAKLAAEFGDVDEFFVARADALRDLANEIEEEVNEWGLGQPAGSVL
jgi:hypothetical protein